MARIKVVGLALVAAFALSAVVANAASAHEYNSEKAGNAKTTNVQVFKAGSGTVECKAAEFNWTQTGKSTTFNVQLPETTAYTS